MDFSVNRSPLKTVVSRRVISFSDISAVNLIVGWNLLASLINRVGTCVFFALYFSSNKVHLTAIIQGTWRNILFFTNYTQIIIIVVNY